MDIFFLSPKHCDLKKLYILGSHRVSQKHCDLYTGSNLRVTETSKQEIGQIHKATSESQEVAVSQALTTRQPEK
jgi:hypothetical protein